MSISTEQVWKELSREIGAFIRRRVRDDELADDLLQETFVRVHGGLHGLEDEGRLQSWVYRVARNAIADHFRRSEPEEMLAHDVSTGEELEPPNRNEEVGGWLIEMLAAIPGKYRDAVRLAEVDGLTQREIGERLGLSLSGAKSRVQRGREMLKDVLLACCHLDFDRHGNVVDYKRRGDCSGCDDC